MVRSIFSIVILCIVCQLSLAQADSRSEEILPVDKLEANVLPALDNTLLKSYYTESENKPLRFAEPRDIHLDVRKDGHWDALKSGRLIWRTVIQSPGAYSLNLAFSRFQLSGDAELYIYSPDKSTVLGPFSEKDNDEHLQLWTPIVPGDKLVVELQISENFLKNTQLEISRINHDFKNILKGLQSGSCNLDVSCGSEDGWPLVDRYRDIISSVGAYTLNGIDQCTGVLVNNTAQDCTPYFLTANHCSVTNSSSPSIVVYWNYENSVCRQPNSFESGRPGDGQRNNFNSGAIHRASLFDSDFTLIELDDPIDPQLNLFFAGWDLDRNLPDTSICIHHPRVEEKRISFEFDRLDYDPNGQDTSFVLVNDWDVGTTEGGSSGSPLFNSRKRIIGQLLGGLAACGNNEYDTYGWIRYSWEGGGTSDSRLKNWLDPNDSGAVAIDGRSCSYNLEASTNFAEICGQDSDSLVIDLTASDFFADTVTYSIVRVTAGMTAVLDFDEAERALVNTLTLSGLSVLEEGRYTVDLQVRDEINMANLRIELDVFNGLPELPELSEPANGENELSTSLDLSIRRTSDVINEFQVSESESFDNILFAQITEERIFSLSSLKTDTEYFWRVRSSNACGTSDWSETFSFKTAANFCTVLTSLDGPIDILTNNAPIVNSSISIPYPVVIQDVNVLNVKGTHSYVGDLRFSLNFVNLSVVLMEELCDDEANFNLGFDDESENLHIACPPTDGLIYMPKDNLNRFNGLIAGGEWILSTEDLANLDGGEFEEWTLEVCMNESLDAAIIPERHDFSHCRNEDIKLEVFYELNTASPDFEIRVFDRNNERLSSNFNPLPTSLSTGELIIETAGLVGDVNGLRVELVSLPSETVLALAAINLVVDGESEQPVIESPVQSAVLKPEKFTEIRWTDVGASGYDVIVSRDAAFKDIVMQSENLTVTNLDLTGMNFDQGDYYIRVISYQECGIINSSITMITLDEDTSTTELIAGDIRVFPNPNSGNFFIDLPEEISSSVTLEFYDLQGRKMMFETEPLSGGKFFVRSNGPHQAVYFLRVLTDGKPVEKKIFSF